MRDIKINLHKSGTWKVQLTIAINFTSSKDVDEEQVMHSKKDNIEFTTYDNANDIVDKLSESLFSRYQIGLETSMRGRVISFLIQFSCCITNTKRSILNKVVHILILHTRHLNIKFQIREFQILNRL